MVYNFLYTQLAKLQTNVNVRRKFQESFTLQLRKQLHDENRYLHKVVIVQHLQ